MFNHEYVLCRKNASNVRHASKDAKMASIEIDNACVCMYIHKWGGIIQYKDILLCVKET